MTNQEVKEALNEAYNDQFLGADGAPPSQCKTSSQQDSNKNDCNCSKAFGMPCNC